MKRQTPFYQHYKGDMRGDIFTVKLDGEPSYYYKIYYLINSKWKLIGQSYVNVFDKDLCMAKMLHDMELVDEFKAKRLK